MIPPPVLVEPMAMLDRRTRREIGRSLRRRGLSYGEIHALTAVPKSTIATWCGTVELSAAQLAAITHRTGSRPGMARDTQWRRRVEIERIRANGREEAETLVADPLWTAGVALYWGEGSKTQRRLEMSNADPRLLRTFMHWVRVHLDDHAAFSASINLHADNDEPRARLFWSQALNLDIGAFGRSFVKPEGTGHRTNTLDYGVCRVKVRKSADMWIRVMTWVDMMASEWGSQRAGNLPSGSLAQLARASDS